MSRTAIKKEDVAEVIREITIAVNKIVDALDVTYAKKRELWMQKFLPQVLNVNPGYNVVVCHVPFKFSGKGLKHHSDEEISGWFGLKHWTYTVLIFKEGEFKRNGDGGWLNWGYVGANCARNGDTVYFKASENRDLEDGEADDGVDREAYDELEGEGPESDEDEVAEEDRSLEEEEVTYDDEVTGASYALGS
ncbi:hypothetical protein BP6252_10856 [Coleophoma cylindrospora]|uniref:Uncharacterized protein n=1 Tax=Coleophoma cylindrospora TaxID=1849047 RepID=A0A3D8QNL4_9HELO|nr:hypothetical protein BP6252_10856 [Coleophoma cylindrospora]